MEHLLRNTISNDWLTLALLVTLLLVSWAAYLYPRRFRQLLLLPITDRYFHLGGREIQLAHPFNLMLFGVQAISVSLFIYYTLIIDPNREFQRPDILFWQICGGYLIFVIVKFLLETAVGRVFNIRTVIDQYLYRKLSYRNVMSIVLFVLVVLFSYTFQPDSFLMLIIVGLVIVLNLIMLIYTYWSISGVIFKNSFYFILYLCTLEISPYVIAYYQLA
ncbi:DUF4271 domain-containing protein [Aureitalea marina]|uniref:DUF4271 domain-containing protein n=1 Tax=Aureitalea marina TaxID=930804 RepID=A0A2S7KT84_9FLAO|nr:DUF4271 domain-containing protein [Aureitalea marina]PQB05827.1 hypothetical protein BST85_13660 [Aureitalea marina]